MTRSIRETWKAFRADTRGVSTVEYALIVVAIVAIVGGGATMLSNSFGQLFASLNTEIQDGVTQAASVDPSTTSGSTSSTSSSTSGSSTSGSTSTTGTTT